MRILERLDDNLSARIEDALRLLSPEEIENWSKHPATQYILARIDKSVADIFMNWGAGVFTEESESGTIQRNATALGQISAYAGIEDDILSLAEVKRSSELDEEEEP